ncbi:Uncharacterised protein [Klebsiella pneumoniae]|nr:Uncharacterised protein [Klebsiella pneumoniae]SUY91736.1 Uncharacterised protein [Klebsiella pneumoniae]
MKYQEMKLYFDKNKGLKSVFVSADVDSSQQAYKVDDGREALALYNEEVKVLDREYGPATIKEEFIAEKGKFGNDSNLLIVFYVQIMPDDLVMQLHRF